MFEPDSRYYKIETATLTVTDSAGTARLISYKRRRFIPSGQDRATLLEHRYQQGERLDNITARYLGNPTWFWQVCDANDVMQPTELTGEIEIGQVIKIALPQL
jgi:hypothetical protein